MRAGEMTEGDKRARTSLPLDKRHAIGLENVAQLLQIGRLPAGVGAHQTLARAALHDQRLERGEALAVGELADAEQVRGRIGERDADQLIQMKENG